MNDVRQLLMVVDDDVSNIKVLDSMLHNEYRLVPRKSGEQVLKYFEKLGVMPSGEKNPGEGVASVTSEDDNFRDKIPDLILLDIMMPGIDGLEICSRLKTVPLLQPIPIIFISGKIEPKDITKGFTTGAVDYVTKPFNASELRARVATHLELKKHRDRLEDLVDERTADLKKEISERMRLEEERQEIQNKVMIQDKLATLGQVATGVAHELNQPLTYITTILQTTIERLQNNKIDPEKLIKKFEKAAHQAARILDITTHLRTVGRADDAKREEVDLSAILDDSLVLMNEKMKLRNISLNANIPEIMPVVLGIHNKLEQIFINLTTNAIDALEKEGGGKIDVEILQEGDTLVVRYSDNGCGIPPEVRDKIFEPFYTTKERGKGTGLGMAIINDIIVDHNGTITCESEQGKGTTFTITLPIQKSDS